VNGARRIDLWRSNAYHQWFPKIAGIKEFIMAINRTRRSSLERRCVSKSSKRLFKGDGKTLFKVIYAAECHARNRKGLGA
jgi:hypothetical protein